MLGKHIDTNTLWHPHHHHQFPKPASSEKRLKSIVIRLRKGKSLKTNQVPILKLTLW